MSESVASVCPKCESKLKVREDLIGKTGRCPNCSAAIVLQDAAKITATSHLPATEKQKAFATSLECSFDEAITRGEISALIERGLVRQNNERQRQIDQIHAGEQSAVESVRQLVLAEMADDPPVSKASREQMMESLEHQGFAAVLVSMPFDQVESFEDLRGVDIRVQSPDLMSREDTAKVLMMVAVNFYMKLGLELPKFP